MKVVVCGGGLAGIAAATVLAENGAEVHVVEAERYLGGRAGAFDDTLASGRPFQMERGFHAFFRQYYNLRALMRRVDPELACLEPQEDYPILGPAGAAETFSGLSTIAPINVAQLVWRTPTLGVRDLMRVGVRNACAMLAYGPHTYAKWDDVSAAEYLDSLHFPEDARRMLFEVFSHSFFNPEEDLSAAELLMQFHFYFMGNREGLVFDTMRQPFGKALFEPLEHYLSSRGVHFRMNTRVTGVEPSEEGFRVRVGGGNEVMSADAVVLALSVGPLRALTLDSALCDTRWRERIASLETTSPFAVWRLWLDRPVDPSRSPFAGTVGHGVLDNISIYEKLEDESRQWAAETGGSVVELHAYALPESMDEAAARVAMLDALHEFYPETKPAQILEERFLLRADCPAFRPGSDALRPGVTTPNPRLVLAGDFVKTPAPSALMERAVMSGFLAANHLLGAERQPIASVPERGMLSALRF